MTLARTRSGCVWLRLLIDLRIDLETQVKWAGLDVCLIQAFYSEHGVEPAMETSTCFMPDGYLPLALDKRPEG